MVLVSLQTDFFAEPGEQQLDLPDADIRYYPQFLPGSLADSLFTQLLSSLDWQTAQIKLYGKWVKIPRLQAWYGDPLASYTYSGLHMQPLPWHRDLLTIKSTIEKALNQQFNGVLANLYRDGQDSMGMHADDEPELGQQPVIASLSLGEPRTLLFKHKMSAQKVKLPLAHGSLLVMAGTTQQYWQHGIAKSSQSLNARINLTFRYLHNKDK